MDYRRIQDAFSLRRSAGGTSNTDASVTGDDNRNRRRPDVNGLMSAGSLASVVSTSGSESYQDNRKSSQRNNFEESFHHLAALLDELTQLRNMNEAMSEQLAHVTSERNNLKVERDQLVMIPIKCEIPSGSNSEVLVKEMEALKLMNLQLSEENCRLLAERNSVVSTSSQHSSLDRENDMEYTALCEEVDTLRAANKEMEAENQEMSNDMHDMISELDELHIELDRQNKEIATLVKEKKNLAKERDQIADKLWAQREKVVDSSNFEELVEKVKQQERAKIAALQTDKTLIEEKLNSVMDERDRLQTRVERLSEELEEAEANVADSKKSIAKWKRVAGIISKEVNQVVEDGDIDDDDSISVCTMQTYHAGSEIEAKRKQATKVKKRGLRRDSDGSSRSVFSTSTLKSVLSLSGLEDGFAPHKRLSAFAQNNSFLSGVRGKNYDEESDDESILMYPSLGSIASGKR